MGVRNEVEEYDVRIQLQLANEPCQVFTVSRLRYVPHNKRPHIHGSFSQEADGFYQGMLALGMLDAGESAYQEAIIPEPELRTGEGARIRFIGGQFQPMTQKMNPFRGYWHTPQGLLPYLLRHRQVSVYVAVQGPMP